uniref:Uncharacterized protein n=1 Tax=Lepeophtheirus salmonis TaxID=72036 RepID=A0A0K2VA56_LEPSM
MILTFTLLLIIS